MARTHAVVIGSSVGGMCAASVLSRAFDRVTIVERDTLPDGPTDRTGVPQGRHVHALLARGRIELERLFPGFEAEAVSRGARLIDFGTEFHIMRPNGWEPRTPTGLVTLWASRVLLETIARARLRSTCANVEILDATTVRGLTVARNGNARITGVQIEPREGGAASTRTIACDLVVDAAGRASKAPQWLQDVGVRAPDETIVDSFGGYASRWFEMPRSDFLGLWIDGAPPEMTRAGVLFPIEGGRCIVTAAGFAGDHPPATESGFIEYLRSLRSPILADTVASIKPLSPVYASRSFTNRFRHYERWSSSLDGFVAIGDAMCAFNPVYGQGMTTSSVCACILRDTIARVGIDPTKLPHAFFKAEAKFLSEPWSLATGADFMFEGTIGPRPPGTRLFHPYVRALLETALEDDVVRRRFGEVANLVRPMSAIMTPGIVARVGIRSLRRRVMDRLRPVVVPPMPTDRRAVLV